MRVQELFSEGFVDEAHNVQKIALMSVICKMTGKSLWWY